MMNMHKMRPRQPVPLLVGYWVIVPKKDTKLYDINCKYIVTVKEDAIAIRVLRF